MLILKKFKFFKTNYIAFNFCTGKKDKNTKIGFSNSSTPEEAIIGTNEKFKENFQKKETMINREEFLKREITSNPEFFKAFPHLKNIIQSTNEIENVEKHIKENLRISDKDKEFNKKNENYFETLL